MTKKSAVGESVAEALEKIASELDVNISDLDFEVVREQFFTADGQQIGLSEIEVVAWVITKTEGVAEMEEWLRKTLDLMGFTATVSSADRASIRFSIDSEEGGRIIGRKGSTLNSIQKMLSDTAKAKGFDWEFSIQVQGGERKEDRDRRDSRDGRDGRDGRGRDSDRGRDRKSSRRDEEKLKNLAKKLAQKVLKDNSEIIIEKELNGFQRRVVHLTIKDIDGVESESFMDSDVKKIRLIPTEA